MSYTLSLACPVSLHYALCQLKLFSRRGRDHHGFLGVVVSVFDIKEKYNSNSHYPQDIKPVQLHVSYANDSKQGYILTQAGISLGPKSEPFDRRE